MKLKSFFAGSVEAALGLAREELGADAILVNSRQAPPEAKHLGAYEVVAAWMPGEARPAGTAAEPARTPGEGQTRGQAAPVGADESLCREVAGLRRQMDRMRRAVWHSGLSRGQAVALAGAGADVLPSLLEADIDPPLAHEIAACVQARMAGDPLLGSGWAPLDAAEPSEQLRSALRAEIGRRFSVDPALGGAGSGPRVVALVGPPGAGKTTTLAKLAVARGLPSRRPIVLLSMDTFRIASIEPLRTYAAILGVGFQAVATGLALQQALQEHRNKDLILIDSPGFGPRDMEAAGELATALGAHPKVDVHLVLAATTKSADLTSAVDRFEIFRPSKLLFTHVEETGSFGPAFSEAARTAKPISFLATGQQVPEDLKEAAKDQVIDLILERMSN